MSFSAKSFNVKTKEEGKEDITTEERGEGSAGNDVMGNGMDSAETGSDVAENGTAGARILETYFIDKDTQHAQIQVSSCYTEESDRSLVFWVIYNKSFYNNP
jgi:hypothetical protein